MRFKFTGNKRDNACVVVKNAESSSTITQGTPAELSLSGTNDGLAVVLPSNSDAKAHAGFFGVAIQDIAAGKFGECAVFGFVENVRVLYTTRSASSTAVWASVADFLVGSPLHIDTVNNIFSTGVSTAQAKSAFLPYAVLAESYASSTTSASSLGVAASTISTIALNVFLRAM